MVLSDRGMALGMWSRTAFAVRTTIEPARNQKRFAKVRLLLDFFVKELARNDLLEPPSLRLKSTTGKHQTPKRSSRSKIS
jgi:hypothetical protein